MPVPDDFFNDAQRATSRIKTEIVLKYFKSWLSIMGRRSDRVGYVDLFSGPGLFTTATGEQFPSTPLKVFDFIASNPALTDNLQLRFNDASSEFVMSLQSAAAQHPTWPALEGRTRITNQTVTTGTIRSWIQPFPSLYFLDPFGYGGFTFDDLSAIVNQHGNDLLFFLNYNRFNAELNHPDLST